MSNSLTMLQEGQKHARRVFFEGSTALLKGQGVCFNIDATGTGATAADQSRWNRVELPSQTNCHNFAGVCAQAYTAVTGGQWVTIYEPGSVCEVLCAFPTTVGVTRIACSTNAADAGWFTVAGLSGRGTAVAIQTRASSLDLTTNGPIAQTAGMVGGATISSTALTWSNVGQLDGGGAAADQRCATESDVFVCLGGTGNTAGRYTISAIPDANTLTLASAPGGSADAGGYIVRGSPTILAILEDGPESGLQMVTEVANNAQSSPTTATGQTGFVYIIGGLDLSAGDCTITLANGLYAGQRKCYYLNGAVTTNQVQVTSSNIGATTSAKNWTRTTDVKLSSDEDNAYFVWTGIDWALVGGVCVIA